MQLNRGQGSILFIILGVVKIRISYAGNDSFGRPRLKSLQRRHGIIAHIRMYSRNRAVVRIVYPGTS